MIRKYQVQDTDALVSVWRSASTLAHPFLGEGFLAQEAENIRRIFLPNADTWVLEHDGKSAGFISLVGDEIGGLFLDPALHGRGFGRAMVDHCVTLKGPLRVEVFEKNAVGRRFYVGYGFVETGRYLHEASGEITIQMAIPSG